VDWHWLRFWEYTTADWAGLQFAVLVIAALVALRQVREARAQREQQGRPFVVMTLDVATTVAQVQDRERWENDRAECPLRVQPAD